MSFKLIKRLFRHLLILPGIAQRHFPVTSMRRIEAAIAESENQHSGEICFIVEANLHVLDILRGKTAKQRAIDVFSQLRVWDTEHNNGVLIYLLLADHDFEILADRGVHQRVGEEGWGLICHEMEAQFRRGQFEAGVLYGIAHIGTHLTQHFPAGANNQNELPNAPKII
ncbi:MAG: TPM domain-containing protein [Pseudomonadota bacterium]